jgi:hypothetical protein
MIAALQREQPRPGREEFTQRLREFARRLSPPNGASPVESSTRRLPILDAMPILDRPGSIPPFGNSTQLS